MRVAVMSAGFVGLRQAVKHQRRRSIAIGVRHLQSGFPYVSIAGLRIKFVVTYRL